MAGLLVDIVNRVVHVELAGGRHQVGDARQLAVVQAGDAAAFFLFVGFRRG